MRAAAHGWVGLGRIVDVASSEQLAGWLAEQVHELHRRVLLVSFDVIAVC